jgi:hypothetical protein
VNLLRDLSLNLCAFVKTNQTVTLQNIILYKKKKKKTGKIKLNLPWIDFVRDQLVRLSHTHLERSLLLRTADEMEMTLSEKFCPNLKCTKRDWGGGGDLHPAEKEMS